MFQTPHTSASLSQEAKEDLRIAGLFQYVVNYNKQMEKTSKIELSRLKLLHERNEAKKQKLESKTATTQQEVLSLLNHTLAIEVQIKKTLQAIEKELNQLQMEFIMVKQMKATIKQKM